MLGPACDNGATDGGRPRRHGRVDPHLRDVLAQLGSPARRAHRGDEPRRAARSRAGAAAAAVARRGWRVHRARRRRRGRHLDRGEGLRSRPRAAEPSGARRLRSRRRGRGGTPDQPRPCWSRRWRRKRRRPMRHACAPRGSPRMRRSGCSSRGRRSRRGCSPGTASTLSARRLDPRLGFLTSSSWNPRAVIPARHARFRAFARRTGGRRVPTCSGSTRRPTIRAARRGRSAWRATTRARSARPWSTWPGRRGDALSSTLRASADPAAHPPQAASALRVSTRSFVSVAFAWV